MSGRYSKVRYDDDVRLDLIIRDKLRRTESVQQCRHHLQALQGCSYIDRNSIVRVLPGSRLALLLKVRDKVRELLNKDEPQQPAQRPQPQCQPARRQRVRLTVEERQRIHERITHKEGMNKRLMASVDG